MQNYSLQGALGKGALGVSLILAMIVPTLGTWMYFVLLSGTKSGAVVYTVTKLFNLFWPLIIVLFLLKRRLPSRWQILPVNRDALALGVVSGSVVVVFIYLLLFTALGGMISESAPVIKAKITQLGILPYYLLAAIFLSLIHSLLEEYYWRWFVYGHLRELVAQPAAHLLAALAFTSHHVIVLRQYFPLELTVILAAGVFVGGVLWSLFYERQSNLTAAWISHLFVDAGLMWVGWRLISGIK